MFIIDWSQRGKCWQLKLVIMSASALNGTPNLNYAICVYTSPSLTGGSQIGSTQRQNEDDKWLYANVINKMYLVFFWCKNNWLYIKDEWKSSKLCFQFQLCLFPAIENKVFLCSISLLLCLLGDSYILGNKQSYVCFPQKWVSHVMVMV